MCLGCVYYAVFHVGSLGFSFHARVPLKCLFSYSSFNIKLQQTCGTLIFLDHVTERMLLILAAVSSP